MVMVKTVLGINHQGLRDWMFQHLTALLLTIYFVGIVFFMITSPTLGYADWHALFAKFWVKIATLIFLLCLMYHAWVGIWTIFTDYVHPFWLRLILEVIVVLALLSYFVAGLLIMWSV
jgi:succinate dehydrogenase / fumarate reductase membrane anchor subunit